GTDAGNQQRYEGEQDIAEAAQHDPEQDGDRGERPETGLEEGADHRAAGLENGDRAADRVGLDALNRARELAQGFVVVGIALRQDLDLETTVLGDPFVRDL